MIIYWCRNKFKKTHQVKVIENNYKVKQNLTPTNMSSVSNLNVSCGIEEFISDYKSQNYSFLSEDSDIINDIKIDNNNSYLRYEQSFNNEFNIFDESKEFKLNFENFKSLDMENKAKFIGNMFEKKNDFLYQNISYIVNLCKNDNRIYSLFIEKITFYIMDIIKSQKNLEIINKLFEILSFEDKTNLIYKILKKTNELLIDERGYKILLLLISFQKMQINNIILYFILQNFIFYCGNPFSSEVIKALYGIGEIYICTELNSQLVKNINEISKLSYGMNIIVEAQKHFHRDL
jgi:hypothetical protein